MVFEYKVIYDSYSSWTFSSQIFCAHIEMKFGIQIYNNYDDNVWIKFDFGCIQEFLHKVMPFDLEKFHVFAVC